VSAAVSATARKGRLAAVDFELLDAVAQPVLVFEKAGSWHVRYANAASAAFMMPGLVARAGPRSNTWLTSEHQRRLDDALDAALAEGDADCPALGMAGPAGMTVRTNARIRRLHAGPPARCAVTLLPVVDDVDADSSVIELKRRTAILSTAMDVAETAVWRWDCATDVVHIEQHFETGRAPRFGTRTMTEFLDRTLPGHRDVVARAVQDALGDDVTHRFEFRALNPSGEVRWYATSIRRYSGADGRTAGLVGATRDATLRKQWELTLAQNEEWLRSILETEPECVKVVDAEGKLRLMNPAGLAMIGADEAESVLGRPVVELVVPEHRGAFLAFHERVMSGDSSRLEFEIVGLGGERRWLESSAAPLHDASGKVTSVLSITRDVTGRRRAEARLQVQAEILETLSEGVVLMDRRGQIQYSNPAFERMLGYAPGSLSGKASRTLVAPPAANITRALAAMSRARRRTVTLELPLARADGTSLLASIAANTVSIGDAVHWIGVVQDVTERRLLEREIIEVASREQERISHDLHDGLGQELTGIALMLKGLEGQLRREAPKVAGNLAEVLGLVNESIHNTRALAHGLSPVAVERGGLKAAVRDLVDRARDAYGMKVRFRSSVPAGERLPPSIALHLYRIAQESLNNVARHAHATHVQVSLSMTAKRVNLRIVDDGVGLPDGFATAGGLGLRIMGYRARMIDAKLHVGPRKPQGTEVVVSCPRQADAGAAP